MEHFVSCTAQTHSQSSPSREDVILWQTAEISTPKDGKVQSRHTETSYIFCIANLRCIVTLFWSFLLEGFTKKPQAISFNMEICSLHCTTSYSDPFWLVWVWVSFLQRNIERRMHHFWFTAWPDHGVPEKTSMLSFIEAISPLLREAKTPNVIHCRWVVVLADKNGHGNTGTYLLRSSSSCSQNINRMGRRMEQLPHP